MLLKRLWSRKRSLEKARTSLVLLDKDPKQLIYKLLVLLSYIGLHMLVHVPLAFLDIKEKLNIKDKIILVLFVRYSNNTYGNYTYCKALIKRLGAY